jgi:hypothetical protein
MVAALMMRRVRGLIMDEPAKRHRDLSQDRFVDQ